MILVTGTGRSGTSLLMSLFTLLNMDTGFTKEECEKIKNNEEKAGLEKNIDCGHYIIKNPLFSLDVENIIKKYTINHIIVPIRNLEDSAKSRKRISDLNIKSGGFNGCDNLEDQIKINSKYIYELIYCITKYDIPNTFIHFPKFTLNSDYLWYKLKWLFKEHNIDKSKFKKVYNEIVNVDFINFK